MFKHKTIKIGLTAVFLLLINPKIFSQTWQEADSLRIYYFEKQSYDTALVYAEKALELVRNEFGENSTLYADMLNAIVGVYGYSGKYEEAIELCKEEMNLRKQIQGVFHPSYGICIYWLGWLYGTTDQFDKAVSLYVESLENFEKPVSKEYSFYGTLLCNLSDIYRTMGQYDKALPLCIESLEFIEKTSGKENSNYGQSLNSLASLYETMGQYDKALPLFTEALENTEKTLGKENSYYGICLNNLANLYNHLEQYDKALPLYLEALENTEKTLGKEHSEYGTRLNNLGVLYKTMGQYDKALPLFIEALKNTGKSLGKENSYYGIRINNLAIIYRAMGQYDKALPLQIESLEIFEKTLGAEHSDYGIRLTNLAGLYQIMGQSDKALLLFQQAINNRFHNINTAFSFLAEEEKENYIKTIKNNFNTYKSFFINYALEKPEVAADAYNIELTTKGMILKSGIQMKQNILQSNNKEALTKYEEWLSIRTGLSKQYAMPIANRSPQIKMMEQEADKLEGELARLSSTFSKAQSLTNTKWQDVQANLSQCEASIEFSAFRYMRNDKSTDSIMYMALLIRPGYKHPVLIPLFEENELSKILGSVPGNNFSYITTLYGTIKTKSNENNALYNLIWQPLERHLSGIKTIYFSPDGLLHKISFSALTTPDKQYLSDIYTLNQVSTTSQIKNQSTGTSAKSDLTATLFGGINYNGKDTATNSRGFIGWNYLEGTKIETDILSKKLAKKKVKVNYFYNTNATESEFKNTAPNSNIIHIATHGFFYPDPEETKKNVEQGSVQGELAFRGSNEGYGYETFVKNKEPLMRSGLIMAGANDVWSVKEHKEGEDGVLTAYEVSEIYMQNTSLVVLSACETGLGDIKGSEGVYGLQRAFKMAGVKYIIMSLWQVPDKETVEFMERFYKKLLKQKNVRSAFNETQKEMRKKYDPYYWAAFVLVE